MFGKNKKLSQEIGDGLLLKIKSIFGTLQGEGPYAGEPAVFIRLSGCNLACNFCDTDFDDHQLLNLDEIAAAMILRWQEWCCQINLTIADESATPLPSLVIITGGEPFRQNIGPLCEMLLAAGHRIQIESNGTIYYPIPPEVEVVCSPKMSRGRYWPINPLLAPRVCAYKLLISADLPDYCNLTELAAAVSLYRQQSPGCPLYIQPIDQYDPAKNHDNLQLATRAAVQFGAVLSLQLHKILAIE